MFLLPHTPHIHEMFYINYMECKYFTIIDDNSIEVRF